MLRWLRFGRSRPAAVASAEVPVGDGTGLPCGGGGGALAGWVLRDRFALWLTSRPAAGATGSGWAGDGTGLPCVNGGALRLVEVPVGLGGIGWLSG